MRACWVGEQEEIALRVLENEDVFVLMPTVRRMPATFFRKGCLVLDSACSSSSFALFCLCAVRFLLFGPCREEANLCVTSSPLCSRQE